MGKQKTAIVLGATGLVGGKVLELLLKDERYAKILVVSRRELNIKHPKLETIIGDLLNLEEFRGNFIGDEVFCCIGTTQAKTPDKKTYRKIDFGIPVSAAQMCKEKAINTFIVISAMGSNANSSIFYNRLKGEMEDAVLSTSLEKIHIVQPSLIGGKRTEKRLGESFFKRILNALDFLMVGPLKKYRVIGPETIAKAMIWLANHDYDKERIPSETLKVLAAHGTS